jgi:hypothetical protein
MIPRVRPCCTLCVRACRACLGTSSGSRQFRDGHSCSTPIVMEGLQQLFLHELASWALTGFLAGVKCIGLHGVSGFGTGSW